ncbi:MAG: EamA family transporter RarD [Rhizobiaceae bacterium]|nr:EamA family transporter RarD [Rhizobiaceae bacterium]
MSDQTPSDASQGVSMRGLLFAVGAYALWGVFPVFLKMLGHMPATEVVAHRVIWSVPLAGVVLWWLGRTSDLKVAFTSPRTLLMATLTAILIAINWGIYIWAVVAGRTVEAALGYYINPLVTVLMGVILLGERFSFPQIVALALAALAVVVLTVDAGGLPWVSLVLAGSFATYGYLRKTLPIGPSQGFFLEVLLLSVPACAYVIWLQWNGLNHFLLSSPGDMGLLVLCGPVTAIPLLLYAFGAKLLPLSAIGLTQYIAPSLMLLIAVFVFGEPFDLVHQIAFALIWLALGIYTWSIIQPRSPAKS